MTEFNYLVIDLGTGNTKVAIISSLGKILGIKSFENIYYKDSDYDDAQFFIPNEWKEKILECCYDLLKDKNLKISAVTSTGARQSIVLYDEYYNCFLGLPNIDNRGKESIKKLEDNHIVYKKTGRWLTEDFPAAKLLGLKDKKIDIYNKIFKFTSISEWIGEIFTGKIAIEPSQACETQLYNIMSKNWDDELCKLYGINPKILPNILNSGEILGKINIMELPELKDIPFIIGGADTQIAIKSSDFKLGDVGIISGTTSPIVMLSKEIYYDSLERCWVDCDLKASNYQIETNPGVTGLNYQRLKNNFMSDISYEEIEKNLKNKKEYFTIASFSTLNFTKKISFKKGGFITKTPFNEKIDVIDLMWATLGDIAASIYFQYKELTEILPNKNDYIIGYGGGFRSEILCQMIVDLTGKKLYLNEGFEQASLYGCLRICNEYYNFKPEKENKFFKIYFPKKDSLIKKYYNEWLLIRKNLNN